MSDAPTFNRGDRVRTPDGRIATVVAVRAGRWRRKRGTYQRGPFVCVAYSTALHDVRHVRPDQLERVA